MTLLGLRDRAVMTLLGLRDRAVMTLLGLRDRAVMTLFGLRDGAVMPILHFFSGQVHVQPVRRRPSPGRQSQHDRPDVDGSEGAAGCQLHV